MDSLVDACLEPERLSLDLAAIYTIEKAASSAWNFDIPAGYEVRQVCGVAVAGARRSQVDTSSSRRREKDSSGGEPVAKGLRTGRAGGSVAEGPESARTSGADRQDGGRLPRPIPLVWCRVRRAGHRAAGDLCPGEPPCQITPEKKAGLRSVSFKEAFEGMHRVHPHRPPSSRPVLALCLTPTSRSS